MSHTAPDFTTIIITISFLLILACVGFFIKSKSGSIKKIIKKQEDLEVLHHMPLRSGYLAFVFKVGEENFFFVGHKTGRGSLNQIIKETSPNTNFNNNDEKALEHLDKIQNKLNIENLSDLKSLKKFIYAWMKDWFKNEDMLKSLNFYG